MRRVRESAFVALCSLSVSGTTAFASTLLVEGVHVIPHMQSSELRDRVSRVAIYVVALRPGEKERIAARRQVLVATENALGFDPGRNVADLAVFKELLRTWKSPSAPEANSWPTSSTTASHLTLRSGASHLTQWTPWSCG